MERENFSYLIFVGGRPFSALVDVWNSYETMTATKFGIWFGVRKFKKNRLRLRLYEEGRRLAAF